jgi:hypothetical protein
MKQYYTRAEALQAIQQAHDHATDGSLRYAIKALDIKTVRRKVGDGVGAPSAVIAHSDIQTLLDYYRNNKTVSADEARYAISCAMEVLGSQAAVSRRMQVNESTVSRWHSGKAAMFENDYDVLMDIYKQLKGGE